MIKIILKDETQIVFNDIKQESHIYGILQTMLNSYKLNNKSGEFYLGGKEFNIKNIKEIIKDGIPNIHNNK